MVTSDFRPEVKIRPFRVCAMHPAIGAVRSLWTWLWSRYHVPQNAFLVSYIVQYACSGTWDCFVPRTSTTLSTQNAGNLIVAIHIVWQQDMTRIELTHLRSGYEYC